MAELFRLRVSQQQTIDVPVRMSGRLGLKPGDELEFLIGDDNSLTVTPVRGAKGSEPMPERLQDLERRLHREAAPKHLFDAALQRSGHTTQAGGKAAGSAS